MPIMAGISAGTSLIGGLIGSSAAKKAAAAKAAAGEAVGKSIDKATGQAIDAGYAGITQANTAVDTGTDAAKGYITDAGATQKGLYGDMTAGLQPYKDAGTAGLAASQIGLDRMQAQGDFSFNPKDMENEPGYQFQLAQGMKGLQASAAARGMLQSGSTLKSMTNYNQGLAGTSYQNAYNRALSTFDTNKAGYQSLAQMGQSQAGFGQNANAQQLQAGSIYGGQVGSLASLGASTSMQGAGLKSGVAMQGNQYVGNTGLAGAEASGNARLGAADASAAGTIGSANSWNAALGGIGTAAQTYGLSTMGTTGGSTNAYNPLTAPSGYAPTSPWIPDGPVPSAYTPPAMPTWG